MMIDFDELLRIILYVGLIVLVIIVIILGKSGINLPHENRRADDA